MGDGGYNPAAASIRHHHGLWPVLDDAGARGPRPIMTGRQQGMDVSVFGYALPSRLGMWSAAGEWVPDLTMALHRAV